MKLAITGKGGAGKSTIAGLLIWHFASDGFKVIGVDADPDSNLPHIFGIPEKEVLPLAEMKDLIAERTGVKSGTVSPLFKLNPRVDDIPEKYSLKYKNIKLLVMGGLKRGGSGCYCPENALLRSLMEHILLKKEEIAVLDMEAGIEHLSRGTAKFVDLLIIVVEPTWLSLKTAFRISKLARDLGVNKLAVIANKVASQEDREFIISNLTDFKVLTFLPFDARIKEANMKEEPIVSFDSKLSRGIRMVRSKLEEEL
ncbi:AAA family ATPase, partial [bacterium]|nr:AAA family ATPase [bacterium]